MSFQVFPRGRHMVSSRGQELMVNFATQRITFSRAAGLHLPLKRVFLLVDEDNKKVGFQPTDDEAGHNCARGKANHQVVVTARAFLEATGLTKAGSLAAIWNEEESRLEVDIPETAVPRWGKPDNSHSQQAE